MQVSAVGAMGTRSGHMRAAAVTVMEWGCGSSDRQMCMRETVVDRGMKIRVPHNAQLVWLIRRWPVCRECLEEGCKEAEAG
jgi:hypothetical protein